MTALRNAIRKVVRAHPSLNIRLNINTRKNEVDTVLPGLRFDDIDQYGQPLIYRVYDMMNSVETAAFYSPDSYLDFDALLKQNYTTITKASVINVKKDFYEVVTPKGPLEVRSTLNRVGKASFNTTVDLFCGGKMKPSVTCKNVHTLINVHENQVETLPDWWKNKFEADIEDKDSTSNKEVVVTSVPKPSSTFCNAFSVPLSDTDLTHTHKTRCASYFLYFVENASIASHQRFYDGIKGNFHEFHIKKLNLLYLATSSWGDALIAESWEDEKSPLTLHCQISRAADRMPIWYGRMDLYAEVFGLSRGG